MAEQNEAIKTAPTPESRLTAWWKKNKKTVLLISGGVLIAAGGIIVYKNWDRILQLSVASSTSAACPARMITPSDVSEEITEVAILIPEVTEQVLKIINGGQPFGVGQHIRNLPAGMMASAAKLAEAAELGIELLEGQTIVDPYMKNGTCVLTAD